MKGKTNGNCIQRTSATCTNKINCSEQRYIKRQGAGMGGSEAE